MQRIYCSSRFLVLLLVCVYASVPALHAQTTEAEIQAHFMGEPLYLKGCWRDDKLHFDPTGSFIGKSGPAQFTSFTLSGFELTEIHLKSNKLILDGRRIGLELGSDKPTRVVLKVGPSGDEDEPVHIEIDASPNGDYWPALNAIFVDGLVGMVPSLPYYWKAYAQRVFLPVGPDGVSPPAQQPALPVDPKQSAPAGRKQGPVGFEPPRLLRSANPGFSAAARALKYSGKATVSCIVLPSGKPGSLSVKRALGLGMDEDALAAVQRYTFEPAKRDGKPIPVMLNVEVNFQLY